MFEREKIAPDWDNFEALKAWRELDEPHFRHYRFPVKTEWYESEGEDFDSTSYPKQRGLPRLVWVFGVLTEDELQILRAFPREVTVYAYDKTAKAWKYFNGECFIERLTPENWRQDHWISIRFHVTQLTEIEPPEPEPEP